MLIKIIIITIKVIITIKKIFTINTIKAKSIDVKFDSYAEYNVDSNDKDPKFKIGGHVRIKVQKYFC